MTIKSLSLAVSALLIATNIYAEETLEEITVTSATKSKQNINSITSNINIITSQEIEDRGFTTVSQALGSLAGISLSSNGGLGKTTSVYLRGFASKRTLVLIDGIRYNDITSISGAPFAHLMMNDIEQVEVVKGAQSGIWGADASAGVINIITKKAKSGLHGLVYFEKGSFNTERYGATLSSKTDTYNFKISHNVLNTDGFTAQAPKDEDINKFEDDGYKNKTTSIQLGYAINETNSIDLSHTIIDADNQYDTFGNPNGEAQSTTKDTFSSINFHHIDSFNTINIYAKKSLFDRSFTASGETSIFDGEIQEYGFTSNIPYRTEDFIVWGVDYKDFEHKGDIGQNFNNIGFFATNSNILEPFFISGKTIITESIRYDNYSSFENKLTSKIGLKHIHKKIEGLVTSINYGTACNVPTLYQLHIPTYGNIDLTPETTKSFDISANYKHFTVTYFHNKITDMIDFDNLTYSYHNAKGTSTLKGFEVEYQNKLFENTLITLNYTNLNAKDEEGKSLGRRANETLKMSVDYYGINNLHLGIDAEYIGKRSEYDFASKLNVETGNYTVANFTIDYDATKNIRLYGKIENLTDTYYQTAKGYATSPRAFSLGLKSSF